ncbi:MAG: type VI secretion system-associated FHA domain protein TagH [Methyloprofundus sp.]|nr:type VI secretion system-associated FHA domain protein TagH [Methyloprofundus sp.]
MKLKLSVIAQAGGERESIVIEQTGASIGRKASNTLVLEDPKRFISGQHATIDYREPDYFITDISTNGVLINDATQPIGNGKSIKLNDNDQLHIGSYTLVVSMQGEQMAGIAVGNPAVDFAHDPFAELGTDLVQGMIDENNVEPEQTPPSDPFGKLDKPDFDDFPIDLMGSENISASPSEQQLEPAAFSAAFEPFNAEPEASVGKIKSESSSSDILADDWFTKNEDKGVESSEELFSDDFFAEQKSTAAPVQEQEVDAVLQASNQAEQVAPVEQAASSEELFTDDFFAEQKSTAAPVQEQETDAVLQASNQAEQVAPVEQAASSEEPFSDDFFAEQKSAAAPVQEQEVDAVLQTSNQAEQVAPVEQGASSEELLSDDFCAEQKSAVAPVQEQEVEVVLQASNQVEQVEQAKLLEPQVKLVVPTPGRSRAAVKPSVAPPSNSDQQALLVDSFLRGAELDGIGLDEALTEESFYIIGKIMRSSIQGTMDVLAGRAKIKNEMHLDVTMIRAVENNPIKFSVTVDEAMKKLLAPQDAGYLAAEESIEEVFDDIRAHQFSVISGMHTALLEVLTRFDPKKLEQRLQAQSRLSASIPVHKQAKLWRLFEELYSDIEHEASDNFYHLFGQAFAESYEKQMLALKNAKKETPF